MKIKAIRELESQANLKAEYLGLLAAAISGARDATYLGFRKREREKIKEAIRRLDEFEKANCNDY